MGRVGGVGLSLASLCEAPASSGPVFFVSLARYIRVWFAEGNVALLERVDITG